MLSSCTIVSSRSRPERDRVLSPGGSVTCEFTDKDQVTSCDVMIQGPGDVRIEVLEDFRPPEQQKPF